MTKFGTLVEVEGPGSPLSVRPGLLGVGEPSGFRFGERRPRRPSA